MVVFVENTGFRIVKRAGQVAIVRLLSSCLLKARLPVSGKWQIALREQKKGTTHTPKFAVRGITERQTLEVELKSDGNDSAWVCHLIPPVGTTVEEAYQALDRHFPAHVSVRGQLEKRMERLEGLLAGVEREHEGLWERLTAIERRKEELIRELQELREEIQQRGEE